MPSSIILLKCRYASSGVGCTIGRGGIVLASLRCIFALKASGTGVPRLRVSLIDSQIPCIWYHGTLKESGAHRSSASSMALRKAVLNSRRKHKAFATGSVSWSFMSRMTFPAAVISSRMTHRSRFSSSERLYVLVTKSSS